MAAQFPQVGTTIRTERELSKGTEAELKRGIQQYREIAAKS
jgi:hypothetical protein